MSQAMTVLRMETKSLVRSFIPHPWIRRTVLGMIALIVVGACAGSLLTPLPPGRKPPPLGVLTGFVVLNLGLAVSVGMGGAARLLQHPERERLMLLAPVRPVQIMWARIGPVLLLACGALSVFFLPFVVVSFRLAPRTGLMLLLLGIAVIGWSIQLALWGVLLLTRMLGRERGVRFSYAVAFVGVLLATMGFGVVVQLTTGLLPMLGFLALTVAVLPTWMHHTGRAYAEVLIEAESPPKAPAPVWGRVTAWRHVQRTPAVWSMAGTALILVLFLVVEVPVQAGMVAMLLYVLATTPLQHAFQPEYDQPDRWALAPYAHQVRWKIMLQVGLPSLLVAVGVLLTVGWGAWRWTGIVVVLLMLGLLSHRIFATLPRKVIQTVLLALALSTQALR